MEGSRVFSGTKLKGPQSTQTRAPHFRWPEKHDKGRHNWKHPTAPLTRTVGACLPFIVQVLEWIKGVSLPFFSLPIQHFAPSGPTWSTMEALDIELEIQNLLAKGVFSEATPCVGQFVSTIF